MLLRTGKSPQALDIAKAMRNDVASWFGASRILRVAEFTASTNEEEKKSILWDLKYLHERSKRRDSDFSLWRYDLETRILLARSGVGRWGPRQAECPAHTDRCDCVAAPKQCRPRHQQRSEPKVLDRIERRRRQWPQRESVTWPRPRRWTLMPSSRWQERGGVQRVLPGKAA